jgi:NOL1/NOP2/fmu family ribosome biogenesis protein
LAKKDDRKHLFAYLEDRFGISAELFSDYLLFKRKGSWQLVKNTPHFSCVSRIKISKIGLRAFRKVGAFIKPTTRMIQIFGASATKARIDITEQQVLKLLARETLPMDLDLEPGYVILTLRTNSILGLGFFINGEVHSQIPRKELRKAMLFGMLE